MTAPDRPIRHARLAAALALLLLATLPILHPAAPASADSGLRVAVLEFTNASTDPQFDPLGKGLQSMLTTDLAAVEALQMVERGRLTEIQDEIDLGRSGAVDADTAVRFGKLAGASHLLAGSFTVVGESMRLDARLFRVSDGSIQFTEAISGETEAFFELEKTLVAGLIKSFGLKLAARERAAVGRIHTADFEAFTAFSVGIDLFDQEAYDDALEQLRAATARDEDFKLARVTLEEYEQLIASLRTRRDELASARRELERLEQLQRAQGEALMVQRLFEIAADGDPKSHRQRLTALLLLTVGYGNLGRNKGKLGDLRGSEDRWAMERTAEVMARSYFSEALPLWPAIPPVIDDDFYRGLPEEDFDADFAEAVEYLFERGADHPENRRNYLLNGLRYPRDMARLLHLDRREEVALRETLIERGLELDPRDYWRKEQKEALIDDYRLVLRLDEATALLSEGAGGEDNPHVLEGIAREVEHNRDYQALLDETKSPERMAEWIMLAQAAGWSRGPIVTQGRNHLLGAEPDDHGWALLNKMRTRGFGKDGYVLLGRHPAWALQAAWWLRTGARSDPLRGDSLRYYKPGDKSDELDTLLLLDGVPREELSVRFELGWQRASDWYFGSAMRDLPPEPEWTDGRPRVAFLFGVRDVLVEKQEDESGEDVVTRPMTGHAIVFLADEIQLVRVTESQRGIWDRKEAFDEPVLERAPVRWPKGKRAKISIRVDHRHVKVTVDGKTSTFAAPTERTGFYGLQLRGFGYADFEKLSIE
jgi:TolB-like protein